MLPLKVKPTMPFFYINNGENKQLPQISTKYQTIAKQLIWGKKIIWKSEKYTFML